MKEKALILNNILKKNGKQPFRWFLVLFSFSIYTAGFFLLFQLTDQRISVLSLLPIIVTSLAFGLKRGLISSLIMIPVNTIYLYLVGLPAINVMIENTPGVIGSIAIALGLGYLSELQKKSRLQFKEMEKEISERKKAEEKLYELQSKFLVNLNKEENNPTQFINPGIEGINNISQKIYREIAENATDIIYTVNLEGYFTYVNKTGINNTGFSLKEFLDLKYTDLVIPEYKKKVKHFYFKQFLEKKTNSYIEIPLADKDGLIKWYGQNATLIFEKNTITGFSIIARDITRRKKIEEDLKKSEEMLRSIAYTANDAIISTDNEFNIIQWNRSAERIFGHLENEVLGKSIKLIVPPYEIELFDNNVSIPENPLRDIDKTKTVERNGYRKNSSVFPVEISIADWKRDNNTFYTFIIRDITERKEAELKIKQSEEDYRQLFTNAHEPILLLKPDDETILEANDRACKVYGFERNEFIGMSMKNISKDVEKGEQKIFETLKQEKPINFETIQYRKDGRELYFEVNASITEYKGEKVILTLNRDISDRVIAERTLEEYKNQLERLVEEKTEKLKETNYRLFNEVEKLTEADLIIQNQVEFFKTLINTIPIPVFIKDENNLYSDCNKAFQEFFGVTKESIIGKGKINLTPVETDKKLSGDNVYETNVVDKDGEIHEVIIYSNDLQRKDSKVEGTVGVILDITQQKNMQKEIKKALDAEMELGQLRTRFVSTASHEFRTPLTSILASTELLQRYYTKWDDSKKLNTISRILNSAEYMKGLISDVLTLNRAESGRISFNPQYIEIVSLCNSVVEEIKTTVKQGQRLEFYSSHEEIFGNFDASLIRQILGNLLSNAVKYSHADGFIRLSLIKTENEFVFEVRDNGIGISDEDQLNLFQPFFRGTNISNIPGTGLGLSILKKAVELHNSKLEFDSKLNFGSTFKVVIPK